MKKIIFDFDGTLVDSMNQWAGKMLNVLKTYGIDYPSDIIKTITPLGDKGTAEYFIKTFGISATPQELIAMMDEYAIVEYSYNIPAKATVIETLNELKKYGFSLNILTASPHKMLDVCLKRVGIWELFDNIWSCDDFGTTKNDVEIYHSVAQRLDTTVDDCILLDDNINALTAAKASGMNIIGVYDDSSADMQKELYELCDCYILQIDELLDLI